MPFSSHMVRIWSSNPNTSMKPISKNCYLVEFENKEDVKHALLDGPWTYRGDLVALCKVNSHTDLAAEQVKFSDIWVQFFNIPINTLTEEGLVLMAGGVGAPLSLPIDGFASGRRFVKMKVRISVNEPINDRVHVAHPKLGSMEVHCHYEKIQRVCRFCGNLRHEMATCKDYMRLSTLVQSPSHSARLKGTDILSPKFGPWITNNLLISNQGYDSAKTYSRRTYSRRPVGRNSSSVQSGSKRAHGDSEEASSEQERDSSQYKDTAGPIIIADGESSKVWKSSKSIAKRPKPAGPNAPALDI